MKTIVKTLQVFSRSAKLPSRRCLLAILFFFSGCTIYTGKSVPPPPDERQQLQQKCKAKDSEACEQLKTLREQENAKDQEKIDRLRLQSSKGFL